MGSWLGGGGAKKAAKRQADAMEKQAAATALNAGFQAEAMANQMSNAFSQRQAESYVEALLTTPQEQVSVNLAPQEESATDLRTRRRGVRSTYRAPEEALI
ncbi:hypothetical protein IVIADoCa7_40 [Xanthomonas phage vB_Xar_IVIA-DoCa7]|uniref:Uncharacterized protein n=1 Tax=Xanthomonas phage vB_Xar_IVIA-DoCa7 TaxID=2975534 RepID=A0A9X9JN31_9CAUD|nr:hypothetical protein IVIADoCa7_40 [Xanthomonas phage vB_Xar_IVIA-DoCa7]